MLDSHSAASLTALNGFLAKTDGRDKLCATLQYLAMFVAAGEPGSARSIASSVAAARKVFRVMRPLEAVTPLLLQPGLVSDKPLHTQVLDKAKALLNTVYFGCDHVVWASQAGIYSNKEVAARCQKASLWGWFGASCCTLVNEAIELARAGSPHAATPAPGSQVQQAAVRERAMAAMQKRLLVLFHNFLMAMTAIGLLQLRPWKPRFVGFLGSLASIINCYMLFPALPAPKAVPTLPAPQSAPELSRATAHGAGPKIATKAA